MRRILTIRFVCALVLALALPALSWAQDLTARLNRDRLQLGESVEMVVVYSGAGNVRIGTPEGDDFEVVSEMTSSSFSYNGRVATAQIQKSFTLVPRREGTLTVGRVPVRTETGLSYTDPLTIVVSSSAGAAPNAGSAPPINPTRPTQSVDPAGDAMASRGMVPLPSSGAMYRGAPPAQPAGRPFIVAQVSDATPTVGQQLVVDYLLYTPAMLLSLQALDMVEPPFDDVWFRDITDDRQGRRNRMSEVVGGEIFDVQVLRSYVTVPLSAGEATIPPIQLTLVTSARQPDGFTVASQPLLLDVAEVPEEGRPDGLSPGNVGTLQMQLTAATQTARVGDPISLTLTVTGVALASGIALPEITPPDGMRLLEGPSESSMTPDASGWLRASVSRQITLVASREGQFEFGALTLPYFEPLTGTFSQTQTQPVLLTISGVNPNAVTSTAEGSEQAAAVELWHNALPPERAWEAGQRGGVDAFEPSRLYFVALLTPVALWLATLLFAAVARRRVATAPVRSKRQAGATALRALDTAGDDPVDILRIVRAYLGELAERPLGAASRSDLARAAHELFGSGATELVAVIDAAELARYSGEGAGDLKQRARTAITTAEATRR